MDNVTYDDIVAEVKRVASGDPDFIYESPDEDEGCSYVHVYEDGAVPGCIFGHVLHNLGVSLEALRGHDAHWDNKISTVLRKEGVTLDSNQSNTLNRVQFRQDHRASWGEAVAIL